MENIAEYSYRVFKLLFGFAFVHLTLWQLALRGMIKGSSSFILMTREAGG